MQAFRSQQQGSARMDFIPPERSARQAQRPAAASRRADIVDAEFETVAFPARKPAHAVFNDNRNTRSKEHKRGASTQQMPVSMLLLAMLAEATVLIEQVLRRISPAAFVSLVAGLCAAAFFVASGMAGASSTALPAGLTIGDVTTRLGDASGMKVISVYGVVKNHGSELQAVPVIEIAVDASGQRRTVARVISGATILAPGESRPFAARLPHAGGKLPNVEVSFGKPDASLR
jgi:hypothetical protein